jgi:hypothetical protein
MRRLALTVALLLAAMNAAFAWGPSGHSIIAEIAQRRLAPLTLQHVADLLGSGASLASIASWADDERVRDATTTRWHFVDIPRMAPGYDPARDCALDPAHGDCIIAAINRQLNAIACPSLPLESRQRALKFLVHFVGDLHQPLHAIGEEGGNGVKVTLVTQEGVNGTVPFNTNLHAVWDGTLIDKTVWSWGSYVERLDNGWLKTADVNSVTFGTAIDWANESHQLAVNIMRSVPANGVLDDEYRRANLPVLDAQLGRAGLRLANTLNDSFATQRCPAGQE